MWKTIYRSSLTVALLATMGLAFPGNVCAQGAQDDVSDTVFLRRLEERLGKVEYRAEYLESYAQRRSGAVSGSNNSIGVSKQGGFERTGSQGVGTQAGDKNYRRIQLKLDALGKKAEKQRESLAEDARAARGEDVMDRERMESEVKRLERDLDRLENELRRP